MTVDVLNELYEQVRVQPHSYVRDLHGRAADEIIRLRAAIDAMTAERDAARAKALEDAAKVADECERQNGPLSTKFLPDTYRKGLEAGSQAIAAAIRAMKEPLDLPPE